jgi:plasmid stabilization system protein ParE
VSDLEAIWQYISRDSPHYARRVIARLLAAVEPLTDFPEMGRKVPEAGSAELRELLVYRYRIIYRRLGERIEVLTIVHGSRDLARLLGRER